MRDIALKEAAMARSMTAPGAPAGVPAFIDKRTPDW